MFYVIFAYKIDRSLFGVKKLSKSEKLYKENTRPITNERSCVFSFLRYLFLIMTLFESALD